MSDNYSINSYSYPICDWLKDARIYNKKYEKILNTNIMDRVDAIVLYFSMLNADRYDIISQFCEIYKNTRHIHLPIEVINIPMDENDHDMWKNFEIQPDWYTLKHGDPLIPILQYRYGITSVPHLLVMQTDGTIISSHGILDLDLYGRNALIAWLTSTAAPRQRLTKEFSYLNVDVNKMEQHQYKRKFTEPPKEAINEPNISTK